MITDPGESIIIVSDIHLGGENSNNKKFCEFLRWINTFPTAPLKIRCPANGSGKTGEKEISFTPLSKIILLGDILDLWDPKDQDRTNVVCQAIEPFSILHDMKCEKIYVTGNHDADIGEIARTGGAFDWGDACRFTIYPRHYPETGENVSGTRRNQGTEINKIRYIFLHGHQFDGEQVPYIISKIINTRFDPIGFLEDLANISMNKLMKPLQTVLIFTVWVIFAMLLFGPLNLSFLQETGAIIMLALAALALLACFPRARDVLSDRKPRVWERLLIEGIFLVPAIGLVVYTLILVLFPGILPSFGSLFLPVIFYVLTFLLAISVIPKGFAWVKRAIYSLFKAKDKTVKEVLEGGYVGFRDTLAADIVIFGHTHVAGYGYQNADRWNIPGFRNPKKLFVNTGCWVQEKDRPVNTFIYIDASGLYLLEWLNPGTINCLFHFPREGVSRLRTE
ncbi:MAG: hypothetical protein ABFC24_07020 [Methanoregulaceae archaeon]